MNKPIRTLCILLIAALLPLPVFGQVIVNSSFETGDALAGWTIGGTTRVGRIQSTHVTNGGVPGGVPDGSWFAVLSTTPAQTTSGGTTARIDNNTTNENDIATLSITVSIPFWPAALEFDWTFPSSEQDQPGDYDDLFDVMVYQGTPPADPTVNNRLFARSAPRNVPQDYSNFTNAHFRGTTQFQQTISRSGNQVHNTSLAWGVAAFRRECIGLDLPEFPGPPYTRTIRFRVADQADRQFDSALFLDRVQVVPGCVPDQQMAISQATNTAGSDLRLKDGGLQLRPVQTRLLAVDVTGGVRAVASNANLDGTNPNYVEQVFIQVAQGGWQRVSGLTINDGGEVQALALSGTVVTGSTTTHGRYLAIAARTTQTGNVEVYRWDRQAGALNPLTTLTNTNDCDNTNPSINYGGTVIAFESTCAALTGSSTAKKIVLWTGGVTNVVTNFQGSSTSCVGRAPALNTRSDQDGFYVAFESNCNHARPQHDGNFEIFRYRNIRRQTALPRSPTPRTRPSPHHRSQTHCRRWIAPIIRSTTPATSTICRTTLTRRAAACFRYTCSMQLTQRHAHAWTDGPATSGTRDSAS